MGVVIHLSWRIEFSGRAMGAVYTRQPSKPVGWIGESMAKTILLADDSLTIQKVVELTFAETEFDVVATSSGDELLERLMSTSPDIIVCDTIMPGTDGYDVCQTIKSDPNTLHIPVVMLTGTFEPFDRDRAMAVGCSEVVTKPFEARKLVETIERLLESGGVAAVPGSMEGAVAPSDFEGAIAPPPPVYEGAVTPPVEQEEEYGTMMASVEDLESAAAEDVPEEGLDFTSTGFAAMEAAGKVDEEATLEAPDHGLAFDEGVDEGVTADTEPIPEAEEPAFKSEGIEQTQPLSSEEIAAAAEMVPESYGSQTPPEPFADAAIAEESIDSGPFAAEEEPEIDTVPPDTYFPEETDEEAAITETAVDSEMAESPELEAEEEDSGFSTGPIEKMDVPEETEAAAEPVEEPPEEPVTEIPAETVLPGVTPAPAFALSDEDIDRIARRVLELAGDRLEKIAWDIIPDMAEIVVKERIRSLEAEIEGEDSIH